MAKKSGLQRYQFQFVVKNLCLGAEIDGSSLEDAIQRARGVLNSEFSNFVFSDNITDYIDGDTPEVTGVFVL